MLVLSQYNEIFKKRYEVLFPNNFSFIIFIIYMGLFINQGLVITASQKSDKSYNYDIVTVVLMTEGVKLLIVIILYVKSYTFASLIENVISNKKLLLLYMVPSFLYCFYNNLSFYNLSIFDPTAYFLILQLRVVITGILFQVFFKKYLTYQQWIALLFLTFGCLIKQFTRIEKSDSETAFSLSNIWHMKSVFILIQIFCSCLAGVYNEKLLKNDGAKVDILIQNIFMYFDSIFWNVGYIAISSKISEAFSYNSILEILKVSVFVIILNNAAIGIVTSYFLQNLNSIMKNFASALELSFTAILSWIIFGIRVDKWTFVSIVIVIYATVLYSRDPVDNRGGLKVVETKNESTVVIDAVMP